ncbi:MAG: hypothetical protein JJV91_00450 [Desulfosarcina sp.]|nr:hypothetical protein [Desulfobacterales bacterium]
MEKIEYIAEVLPDGHLSLPESIIKQLRLKAYSKLRVQIQFEKKTKRGLSRFCGQWQDDDVVDIVNDIYHSRDKNIRSENVNL